jgi:methyl-accepting chemotaxis protein
MRRGLLKDLIIQTDANEEQATQDKIDAADELINKNLGLYEATLTSVADREIFDELEVLLAAYEPLKEGFITYAIEDEDDMALALMSGEGAETTKRMEAIIEKIIKNNLDTGRALSDNYMQITNKSIYLMIGIIGISVGLSIALSIFISRIISKPIKKLVDDANKIADGELDITIQINTKDEVGVLAQAFARMTDNLNDIMSNINEAAAQVASGSKQISDSSLALSQGATEQASSVEELTASLEEISVQTNQNAKNADEANLHAEQVRNNAIQGNEQMKEMLNAMDEINNSSSNISKIIKVIDEIAFQTNILALNAAVEAARAGQHGKGFAVVAEEVRNLAARSANAAKETTDMIEGSIKKTDGGTKTARKTAEALNMIVDGVSKVAGLVGDIATASKEQASQIAQVNQGIMQVSTVVQTNSATSEETAAASEELASQADLLNDQVSRFKLRESNKTNVHDKNEMISKEVLLLLNHMKDKNQPGSKKNVDKTEGRYPEIILSDKEYGKY